MSFVPNNVVPNPPSGGYSFNPEDSVKQNLVLVDNQLPIDYVNNDILPNSQLHPPPATTSVPPPHSRQAFPAFHNPFDVNSYPLTNPPIFDSTMLLPYNGSDGVPRRRRISISNGQIGQIIDHKFFDDENSSSPFDDLMPNSNQQNLDHVEFPVQTNRAQSQPQAPKVVPGPPGPQNGGVQNDFTDAAGVPPPNYSLIYNNEVIYNPNDGPIPGTAAWKKERLLERNRVAASKCRQRKKQAHQQLQDNIFKYETEIAGKNLKIAKYEVMVSKYNKIIAKLLEGNEQLLSSEELKKLKHFMTSQIDDIDKQSLDKW